jgi:NAD-dependent oxidoreductase involved in siderophore biosynthesis
MVGIQPIAARIELACLAALSTLCGDDLSALTHAFVNKKLQLFCCYLASAF